MGFSRHFEICCPQCAFFKPGGSQSHLVLCDLPDLARLVVQMASSLHHQVNHWLRRWIVLRRTELDVYWKALWQLAVILCHRQAVCKEQCSINYVYLARVSISVCNKVTTLGKLTHRSDGWKFERNFVCCQHQKRLPQWLTAAQTRCSTTATPRMTGTYDPYTIGAFAMVRQLCGPCLVQSNSTCLLDEPQVFKAAFGSFDETRRFDCQHTRVQVSHMHHTATQLRLL